jgi:CTP:molybdopterin cytidylyltransferase MocA
MKTERYAAVVLAAGFSSRMGDFKPLMKIGGVTVADRVIALFRNIGIEVIMVTGWRQEELLAGIDRHDITVTENPDYATGMLSSVQAGVKKLPASCESFFLMPVDIPLVRPATIQRLIAAADTHPGTILYPVFRSKHGHPPVIPSFLSGEITGWHEEGGLNTILARHKDLQREVPVADSNVLADADRQADFSKLLRKYEQYHIPDEAECRAILDIAGTPERTRNHACKVRDVAAALGRALADAGVPVNTGEVEAAALLHDVAKGQPDHEAAGARMLSESGFSRIGDIVSVHQELVDDIDSVDIETKLVYLADKMVIEDRLVPVEQRYRASEEKYGHIPDALENIIARKNRAQAVKAEVETMLGQPVECIIGGLSS